MAGVFARTNEVNNHPKRNTFPLSFQNNLSGKFGILYPCLVQDVIPGFTFKVKPTFALEFMPTAFPVQTRMRARMHFFYVRNRNLWKDFADFYGKTKEGLVSPYLHFAQGTSFNSMAKTGSLGDYLGLPTTFAGSFGDAGYRYTAQKGVTYFDSLRGISNVDDAALLNGVLENNILPDFDSRDLAASNDVAFISYGYSTAESLKRLSVNNLTFRYTKMYNDPAFTIGGLADLVDAFTAHVGQAAVCLQLSGIINEGTVREKRVRFYMYPITPNADDTNFSWISISGTVLSNILASANADVSNISAGKFSVSYTFTTDLASLCSGITYDEGLNTFRLTRLDCGYLCTKELFASTFDEFKYGGEGTGFFLDSKGIPVTTPLVDGVQWSPIIAPTSILSTQSFSGVRDITFEECPWTKVGQKGINISALPFRAYESIYNAFYRDQRNNPYMIDGVPEYNKWIPSTDGGVDNNVYSLHYANWEQDFLTTAVQSPQQGIAPLVGIVSNNGVSSLAFTDAETGESFTAQVDLNEDGTVKEFKANTSDMPVSQYRTLIDFATSGISINDFRNVNALQRWLETNMRKGYRLKDIIKGHYDVNVRFDELDMPEFIGGVTQDVMPTMVTQTTEGGEGSPLGSYAGQLSCVGTSKHSIRHYCDEPGWIIGILSVVPVPNYSQLLPKYFMRDNVLDYFFPEFGHIGYQPITYREVCPIQAKAAGKDLSTVFGYQRAWYEYISRVDEVHGQMRTSLRNFLVNRVFDVAPELSESFLLVDPSQTNQIFTVTAENEDVWMGQVYFDYQAKEPIPLYGIPKLE
jgi:hypothetical protein